MIKSYNNQYTQDWKKISEDFPNSFERYDFYNFKYRLPKKSRIKILEQIKANIRKTYNLFKNNEGEICKRYYEIAKSKNENQEKSE